MKKYNLCRIEKNSYFIECVKNDIYVYHRTDSEKDIDLVKKQFKKLESLSEFGFEGHSDTNCSREKYHLDYEIILSFNSADELENK